jgi:hypothetical protein
VRPRTAAAPTTSAAVSEVTGLYIDRYGMSETLLTKVLQHTQKTANQFFLEVPLLTYINEILFAQLIE